MNSMRSGGGAPGGSQTHGPESPVLGSPGFVSSFQQTKEYSGASQNMSVPSFVPETAADAAAVAAVEARNTYRLRPLPTPPRSKASSTMAERPSTSGGLSPHNASTVSFRSLDRRMSKDDMYIRPHSSARGGYKSYHIPIRDNPASPVESPGDFSPARTFTVRTQTPDSMDSNMGTIAIGMAIGSPTHPPPEFSLPPPPPRNEWQPQTSSMSTSMMRASPEPTSQEPAETAPPPTKQKSGRWKLFGRSKSKRVATSPVISQPMNLQQPTAGKAEIEIPLPTSQATDLGRRNTERRPGDSKPAMVRSQTAGPMPPPPPSPREAKPPNLLSRMASTRSTRGEKVKKSDISGPVHVSMGVPAMPTMPTKPMGNFLDVEIPSIKMERYSVMFGNVLGQPQEGSEGSGGGQQSSQPASALLARRQATLDRLKTINGQYKREQDEQDRSKGRRATSPQPLKSPAFSLSLFPATPSGVMNKPQLNPPQSPRYRSNTSPAHLASPTRSSFEPSHNQSREILIGRALTPDARPYRPQEPRAYAPGPSHLSLPLDSPTNDRESEEIHLTEQLKPTIYEPEWQMITSSESTAPSSVAASAKDRSPASETSVRTHVTKPSLDESEPDDALRAAVEISIARQISISRQQRRMLRPLKTQIVRTGGSPGVRSPVTSITVGKNERLSSTKIATPTLISHAETFEQQIAQNRKSSRIIVEGE
ncbi:hypothetical protein C8034_v002974 [Colletotrichum sidae]|uniref:Uncharacterized protein n=1 Tax=Colletotrichum sidae TaxID=1347389 RepID=A0A4R8PY11_9PEZI|nr:hypothetical protein C8034_v002974 [Colletotrichum sidae]